MPRLTIIRFLKRRGAKLLAVVLSILVMTTYIVSASAMGATHLYKQKPIQQYFIDKKDKQPKMMHWLNWYYLTHYVILNPKEIDCEGLNSLECKAKSIVNLSWFQKDSKIFEIYMYDGFLIPASINNTINLPEIYKQPIQSVKDGLVQEIIDSGLTNCSSNNPNCFQMVKNKMTSFTFSQDIGNVKILLPVRNGYHRIYTITYENQYPQIPDKFTVKTNIVSVNWPPLVAADVTAQAILGCYDPKPADPADFNIAAAWLANRQFKDINSDSYGAIKVHYVPGYRHKGADNKVLKDSSGVSMSYYRVAPYFTNIAVTAVLQSHYPGKLVMARRWMIWYLKHTEQGDVYDHWYYHNEGPTYQGKGFGETKCLPGEVSGVCPSENVKCDYIDASDSYAATFLDLAWTYYKESENKVQARTFLLPYQTKFIQIADLIVSLQDGDGLTWALACYKFKYLMDNSEVYRGLVSAAKLMDLFNNFGKKTEYEFAAVKVLNGINNKFLANENSPYFIAIDEIDDTTSANANVWYSGNVNLLWPILYGVIGPISDIAEVQFNTVNTNFPNWSTSMIAGETFLWPQVGYAAYLNGDCKRAREHVELFKEKVLPLLSPPHSTSTDVSYNVLDVGLFMLMLSKFAD